MLSTTPINYNGQEIVPIQFTESAAARPRQPRSPHQGQDEYRLHLHRQKDGKDKTYYIL